MVAAFMLLEAIGLTVLHSLWQGLLAALWLALAMRILPGATARYFASLAALTSMAAAAALTLLRVSAAPEATLSVSGAAGAGLATSIGPATSVGWVGIVWAVGCALALLRVMGGLALLRQRVTALCAAPAEWSHRAARLGVRLGVRRAPRVVVSTTGQAAYTIGWLRPMIVLPIGVLAGLPLCHVEAILAHELAHVRRQDYLFNLAQRIVECAFFYHPAAWWIGRRARDEREHRADELVVRRLIPAVPYARALASLEETRTLPSELALAAHGGGLMKRIQRIAALPDARPTSRLALLALAAPVVLAAACASFIGEEPELTVDPAPDAEAANVAEPDLVPEVELDGAGELTAESRAALGLVTSQGRFPPELEPYRETFFRAGRDHAVDPELLAAVALIESAGDPHARSPLGAIGLMQLMPDTAASIAVARGMPGYDEASLEDPAYSIDMAAWYLARQLEHFGEGRSEQDAVALAAAAYNAGPSRLERHLTEGGTLSSETENYQDCVVILWTAFRNDWSC